MTANMMIATILQRDPQNLRECIAMWRQLSDIVAQRGMQLNQYEIQQSLRTLARLRNKVPEHVRRDTALSVAHHGRFAPLVALYANDTVMVAAAMLQNAHLPTDDWLALLPATNDVARSILAGRTDLHPRVRRALESLGAGAMALPPAHVASIEVAEKAQCKAAPPNAYFADEQPILARQGKGVRSGVAAATHDAAADVAAHLTRPPLSSVQGDRVAAPDQADLAHTGVPVGRAAPSSDYDEAGISGNSPISELVRRIDRFQSSKSNSSLSSGVAKAPSVSIAPDRKAVEISPPAPAASSTVSTAAEVSSTTEDVISDDILSAIKAIEALIRSKLADTGKSHAPVGDMAESGPLPPLTPTDTPPKLAPTQFHFHINSDGLIDQVDGVSPALVIGMSIVDAETGVVPGTDAAAAGAFRQRAEILHSRIYLGGKTDAAGEWIFSADPIFDKRSGQFQGYSAIARRPLRRDRPYGQSDRPEASDSIRQFIHELRSPLNAISGFAQIISGQIFGPVSESYRAMADSIIEDAASVQSTIEDLDAANAQAEVRKTMPSEHSDIVDIADVVDFVVKDLQPLLAHQGVGLNITQEGGPFLTRTDLGNARRMIGRLLTALIDVSESESLMVGQLIADLTASDVMQLRIVRPSTIRFASAEQLLDPGYSPEGEAPAADILSLGFSLRLVGSLAASNGGALDITPSAIALHLPLATSDASQEKNIRSN